MHYSGEGLDEVEVDELHSFSSQLFYLSNINCSMSLRWLKQGDTNSKKIPLHDV